jgi:hypothetical protein
MRLNPFNVRLAMHFAKQAIEQSRFPAQTVKTITTQACSEALDAKIAEDVDAKGFDLFIDSLGASEEKAA